MIKHIKVFSDLHLEFAPFEIPEGENEKETLLILAGDIGLIKDKPKLVNWLLQVVPRFAHTIYVFGNHEHYRYDINCSLSSLERFIKEDPDFSGFRDKITITDHYVKQVVIDNVRVIASTLWTDFNNGDPITKQLVGRYLNDFSIIYNEGTIFSVDDALDMYNVAIDKIKKYELQDFDGTTIVVTHHAPCENAISERYKNIPNGWELNGGYRTLLENYILESNIDYWFFGHTHNSCDIMLGKTRVVNNCRGYPFKDGTFENKEFKADFVIDL